MLKLKRVEIQGFKSFYDRTEMKFNGQGIAAIVGPNGCGKSNLSEAISWVLGEQSAKTLRGSRMEDVIFAGTRDRKALGMASVTMTLVPEHLDRASTAPVPVVHVEPEAQTAAPAEPGEEASADSAAEPVPTHVIKPAEKSSEITITRRLYRSGDSEYLINGKAARLRDIQNIFLGTGLGPESYAIIEQGRIGQILSNRPQDRRNVIEEAAGITRFKTRKRLAETKLESAKQNLARVFDILEEVTRQVNSLKRQAAKTKRYEELRGEARQFLREILAARFKTVEREMTKVTIELSLATAELEAAHKEVAGLETEQSSKVEALYATEQQLTAARKLSADLHLEAERVRGRLEYQVRSVEGIDKRLASGQQEQEVLEHQEGERIRELEAQTVELTQVEADCAAGREELDARAADRQAAQGQLAEQERGLEALRHRVLRLLGESSNLKNRITQVEAQLASADRERARAQVEEEQSVAEGSRLEQARAQLSDRLAARQTELLSVADQRKAIEEELEQKRSTLNMNRQALDRLRSEYSRIKARKDSLDDVIQHRSYTTETVKKLFSGVESGKVKDLRPVGVLADFIEVEPQFEKPVEEFLHDELEYVVVREWPDAERGIELMRSDFDGRASFLVENGGNSPNTGEVSRPEPEQGRVMPLRNSLRFTNGLSQIPLQYLPRIANCFVVTEHPRAQQLANDYPHCWFLTTDGAGYHGRAVSGGKKSGAGPLALKRELRELSRLEEAKNRVLNTAQADLLALERSITALAEQQEQLRSRQQAQEKDVLALDHESRKLAEEWQRVQARLSRARLELDRLGRERVKLEENLERDRSALDVAEQAKVEGEEALEAARDQLRDLQAVVAQAAEEHASVRASLASLEERRRSVSASRSRLEGQVQDLANRRAQLIQETERLTSERVQLLRNNTELQAKSAELTEQIAAAGAQVEQLAEQEAALRAELSEMEEALKQLRGRAQETQERRSSMQVTLARAETEIKHLEETCQKELETNLQELAKDLKIVPAAEALAELEAKYTAIRQKIDALGPVNPQALEEYEEAQQRQDFLNAQRQDLLDSIRDTEKAISEIDTESRKRFGEAFHAINANFREMFKVLFAGGTGEMRLTDEDNLAESGIDIVASPPGKKLQSVLLLSGGEKSLTAMALLMAIFQYTPSPFCILDEVDAPLDEANIERLTRLLREMADQTQFIVITHAKRTMEAAQALYGVTMQEPGISKLVSVKFKQTLPGYQERRKLTEPVNETAEEPSLDTVMA